MSDGPHICIDARLAAPGLSGGVEQVIIGLASGFSQITDGDERYSFLTYPGADKWLSAHVDGPCQLLHCEMSWQRKWRGFVASNLPFVKRALERVGAAAGNRSVPVAKSDGTIEKAGVDLMHFTLQSAFLTPVPSIYHPHDLQHLHLPEYFSDYERRGRSFLYKKFSDESEMVAVASSWTRGDVIRHLGLADDKVQVVPLAPSTEAYSSERTTESARTKEKYELPDEFIFYPAQTWPHKNHLGLIDAAAILRDRYDMRVPVVFSGRMGEFYGHIAARIRALDLTNQIRFLGFVTPDELQALYTLCRCVVLPTKFEAASFPLFEAFLAGAPTACSNVTSLPDQAGDAALIFDPNDSAAIAESIIKLWNDEKLRLTLAERGKESARRFTWIKTATHFRSHYRRILGSELTDHDKLTLSSKPLL